VLLTDSFPETIQFPRWLGRRWVVQWLDRRSPTIQLYLLLRWQQLRSNGANINFKNSSFCRRVVGGFALLGHPRRAKCILMSHQTGDNTTELGFDESAPATNFQTTTVRALEKRSEVLTYSTPNKSNASSSPVFEKCLVCIRAET